MTPTHSIKRIEVGSELTYEVRSPTSFLFQIAVTSNQHQRIVTESLELTPVHDIEQCKVGVLGNRMQRLEANPGQLTVRYTATVELDQDVTDAQSLDEVRHADLPSDVLAFLNPSRYCESDRTMKFAWDEFGEVESGHERVRRIVDWVNRSLSYVPGSTGPTSTACDVLLQRAGVCRDYSHVAITLCRSLGIPARYVAGYAVDLEPPDFHGFFEVYLADNWYLFDATRLAPVSGFVRIGAGRDAADVSFATRIGDALSTSLSVWAYAATDRDVPRADEPEIALSSA